MFLRKQKKLKDSNIIIPGENLLESFEIETTGRQQFDTRSV